MEQHYSKQKRTLRCGYTTGSCAAAAAKASALMLLTGQPINEIDLLTPQGNLLTLQLEDIKHEENRASCAIRKDSGDDPDITNGILIYASVSKSEDPGIVIEGGAGVGKVTKPGLACKVGEAAINPVPKKMILSEVQNVCQSHRYVNGLTVIISVPEGENLAKKTFNPRLGISGGISILGTTGIVEPKSVQALLDTIYLEMKQQRALGNKDLLLCPGNYGQTFIKEVLQINLKQAIKCSNYIGEALDFARELAFESLLLIGHVGKLIKLGAGIMNTHSSYADARLEIIALHAALLGTPTETIRRIMDCNTTEEAVLLLKQEGIMEIVFANVMTKIDYYVQHRLQDQIKTGVVVFSNELGLLGQTPYAEELIKLHQSQ